MMKQLLNTVFCLLIGVTFTLSAVSCQQDNNQQATNPSANAGNSSSAEKPSSFVSLLSLWQEVAGLDEIDDLDSLERLYVWAEQLFVIYISKIRPCSLDDVFAGMCGGHETIVKQVAPGQWEERSASDLILKEIDFFDLPDDAPNPVYKAIKFAVAGRCIVAVSSDDGVHFFEDGFGWQQWSDGLSGIVSDFEFLADEESLYALSQDNLFKLSFEDVEALSEEFQLPESERQCIHHSVSVE